MEEKKIFRLMKREEEEICVCRGCEEEVSFVGEDGISLCEGCGIVEGYTKYIKLTDYEDLHG